MNVTFLSLNFHLFYENSKRLCVFISKKHTKKKGTDIMVQIYQILLVSWTLLGMDFKKEYPSGKERSII